MDKEFVKRVADLLKISPDLLDENSATETVPEWDSLNHWLVIGELETYYNVDFTMDEATEVKNLGDIYRTLQEKVNMGGISHKTQRD